MGFDFGKAAFELADKPVQIPKLDAILQSELYDISTKNMLNPYKVTRGITNCLNVAMPSDTGTNYYTEKIPVEGLFALYFTNDGVDAQARFVTPLKADGTPHATTDAQFVFLMNYAIPAGVTHVIVTYNASTYPKFAITRSIADGRTYEPYYIPKTPKLKESKNLFDKSKSTDGAFINWDTGNTQASTTYWYSDYIEVLASTGYAQSHETHMAYYDANKVFISGRQKGGNKTFTTPSNAKFVRVSLNPLTSKHLYQLEKGSASTEYVGFGFAFADSQNGKTINFPVSMRNVWKFKNGDCLGDSISEQFTWQPYVKDVLGLAKFSNHGIGGTKISGTGADSMCNDARINALDSDADLITVMGGTNDWVQNVPLGDINSTDVNTFYGAVKVMIEKLVTRFPSTRIVVMSTPYGMYPNRAGWTDTTGIVNNLGLTTGDYGKVLIELARMYGLPSVDIYGNAGWNKINIATYVTNDGAYLHPNSNFGGRRIAEVLIGRLKSIEPII